MIRLAVVFVLVFSSLAGAVEPDEVLADPALETRAREISVQLRCLVCQNQSIDDSNAPLAKDLRVLVRERLVAGDSDAVAVAYIVDRYGDFVLLRPPVRPTTYILWFGPAAIFLAGGAVVVVFLRRRTRRLAVSGAAPLSDDERRRIERLLEDSAEH